MYGKGGISAAGFDRWLRVSMMPQPQVADFAGKHGRQVGFPVISGADLYLSRHQSAPIAGGCIAGNTDTKWLFFANQGAFRTGDYEEIMNKASCLSLLSNAVLVWNTVQIERIVGQLRATGNIVLDEDLSRVSPLFRRHITPNGSYFHAPRIRAPIELPILA